MPSRLSITVVKHSDEDLRIIFSVSDLEGRVSSVVERKRFYSGVEALDYLYDSLENVERFF